MINISSALTGCLSGNAFKYIVDKRVKDGHCFVGYTSIGVDLFKDYFDHSQPQETNHGNIDRQLTLVDVRRVCLLASLLTFLLFTVSNRCL